MVQEISLNIDTSSPIITTDSIGGTGENMLNTQNVLVIILILALAFLAFRYYQNQ